MVVIRLSRGGAPKKPQYRIVVTDKAKARDSGRAVDNVGYFNPCASGKDKRLHLDLQKVDQWIQKGAQPSERVKQLIKDARKEQRFSSLPLMGWLSAV